MHLTPCGWALAGNFNGTTALFDQARRELAMALAGPHPVSTLYWGNTRTIQAIGGCVQATPPRVLLSTGSVASSPPNDYFGYHELWWSRFEFGNPGGGAAVIDKTIDSGGANTARINVSWNAVQADTDGVPCQEPHDQPNQWPGMNWSSVAPLYNAVVNNNMQPILEVTAAPCWADHAPGWPPNAGAPQEHYTYCGAPHQNAPPPHFAYDAAWQAFITAVANRFPKAKGIEIWNEPNNPAFWGGCADAKDDHGRYGQILRRAFQGVRASTAEVDGFRAKDIPVVSAGLLPKTTDPYLENLYNWGRDHKVAINGVNKVPWDAVGLHPYRTTKQKVDKGWSFVRSAEEWVKYARSEQTNATRRPIWVTEVGVSTIRGTTAWPKKKNDPLFVEGADRSVTQAQKLTSIYNTLRAKPHVPVVIVFRLKDNPGEAIGAWERGGGAVKQPQTSGGAIGCIPFLKLAYARGVTPTNCSGI